MKKRALMIVLAIFLTWIAIFLVLAAVQINKYIKVQKVCRDLHEGTYIHSDIGDGTTCPIWLHYIMLPTEMFTVETPLTAACFELNYDAVCEILANGADPNRSIYGYWTPLEATYVTSRESKKSGDAKARLQITLKLFEYGARIEENKMFYVQEMAHFWQRSPDEDIAECIRTLVNHGATLCDYTRGWSFIRTAVRQNSIYLCEMAINEYGFTLEEKNNGGQTPLFCTTFTSNGIETARYLIEKGASKSVIDNNGKTAYDYALEKGYLELADLLRP